jgi:hypothetical protein
MVAVTIVSQARPSQTRRLGRDLFSSRLSDPKLRYVLGLYLASRLLFLAIAGLNVLTQHKSLAHQMSNWDAYWYLQTAAHWYMHNVPHQRGHYSTLGFEPFYPVTIWLLAHVTQIGNFGAGITISLISGAVATVLIGALAEDWWGEEAGRRAIMFWCFFPGTIVFSMAYSEGLTLTLIVSAMILLNRRRWIGAAVLAGFATAIAPVALSAVPMTAAAVWQELRSRGYRASRSALRPLLSDREARRPLLAVPLCAFGVIGFAIFLKFWTGSPFADYTAQHVAWSESTTPLAIPRVAISLIHQMFISGVGRHGPGGIDMNGIVALLGTVFLVWGFWTLWQRRQRVPLTIFVWTICVAFLALTSAKTPPNPRMLLVAFPLVIAVGANLTGKAYRRAMVINVATTLVMSYFTYVGIWLRP